MSTDDRFGSDEKPLAGSLATRAFRHISSMLAHRRMQVASDPANGVETKRVSSDARNHPHPASPGVPGEEQERSQQRDSLRPDDKKPVLRRKSLSTLNFTPVRDGNY